METDLGGLPTPGAPPDDDHRVSLNGRHKLLRLAGNRQLLPLLKVLGSEGEQQCYYIQWAGLYKTPPTQTWRL